MKPIRFAILNLAFVLGASAGEEAVKPPAPPPEEPQPGETAKPKRAKRDTEAQAITERKPAGPKALTMAELDKIRDGCPAEGTKAQIQDYSNGLIQHAGREVKVTITVSDVTVRDGKYCIWRELDRSGPVHPIEMTIQTSDAGALSLQKGSRATIQGVIKEMKAGGQKNPGMDAVKPWLSITITDAKVK